NALLPGFEKIMIKPQITNELKWARGEFNSIRGLIQSDWRYSNNIFSLQVTIPSNSRAEIWIPSNSDQPVKEGGKILSQVRYEKGYAIVEVGSVSYIFESSFTF